MQLGRQKDFLKSQLEEIKNKRFLRKNKANKRKCNKRWKKKKSKNNFISKTFHNLLGEK